MTLIDHNFNVCFAAAALPMQDHRYVYVCVHEPPELCVYRADIQDSMVLCKLQQLLCAL